MGEPIIGAAVGDEFGNSVNLSSTGDRVVIGAWNADPNGITSGCVGVYEWNYGTSTWTQMGQNINGAIANARFGNSVSISGDGSRIIVGAYHEDNSEVIYPTRAGAVRIYEWDSNLSTWNQIGETIRGLFSYDGFGTIVQISQDGNRIAIISASFYSRITGSNFGSHISTTHIFEWSDSDGEWLLSDEIVHGYVNATSPQHTISLSGNGNVIVYSSKSTNFTYIYKRLDNGSWNRVTSFNINGSVSISHLGNIFYLTQNNKTYAYEEGMSTIRILGSNPYNVSLGSTYIDTGARSQYNYDVSVNSSNVNTNVVGTYEVIYTTQDSGTKRIVTVSENSVMSLIGDNPYYMYKGLGYKDPGVTTTTGQPVVVNTEYLNTSIPGEYVVYYSILGDDTQTKRVVIVKDLPTITLLGDNPYHIYKGVTYADPGALSSDGETVTADVQYLDTNKLGTYKVYYNSKNGPLSNISRTVIVNDDPKLILKGPNPQYLSQGADYREYGFETTIPGTVNIDIGSLDTSILGTYIVRYTIQGISIGRTVIVDGPVITLSGDNPLILKLNETFIDPGATADGGESVSVNALGLDTSSSGVYDVIYTAINSRGNIGITKRTVIVGGDVKQFGQDIDLYSTIPPPKLYRNSSSYYFGTQSCLSLSGIFMAVSEPGYDNENGRVRVYEWSGNTWTQIGSDILGENTELLGLYMQFSPSYESVLIMGTRWGSIKIYQYVSGSWTFRDYISCTYWSVTKTFYESVNDRYFWKYGDQSVSARSFEMINGLYTPSFAATTISISNYSFWDTISIYSGYYAIQDSATSSIHFYWFERGQNFDFVRMPFNGGELSEPDVSGFGQTIKMSQSPIPRRDRYPLSYNQTIAVARAFVGTWTASEPIRDQGRIDVYDLMMVNDRYDNPDEDVEDLYWVKAGSTIYGLNTFDRFGKNMEVSLDGRRIIIGSRHSRDGINKENGKFTVYEWDDSKLDWIRIQTVVGPSLNYAHFAMGVSISSNGNRMCASSAYRKSKTSTNYGYVKVYSLPGDTNNDEPATLLGDNPYYVQIGTSYSDPGVNYNPATEFFTVETSNLNMNELGTQSVECIVRNQSGSILRSSTRTVIVDPGPIITLNGDNPYIIQRGFRYSEPGATSDGGEPVSIDTSNVISTEENGVFSVYYSAQDNKGIISTKTRSVIVESPSIILYGSNPHYHQINKPYIDAGAFCELGENVTIDESNLNTSTIGTYSVNFYAVDEKGFTSTLSRTVIVTDLTLITLEGDNPYRVDVNSIYSDPGATATDGSFISVNDSNVNTSTPGTYNVYFRVIDSHKILGYTTRTVLVGGPVITLNGNNPHYTQKDASYSDPGATSDGGETVTIDSSALDTNVIGSYTVTYSATDSDGQTGITTRSVIVDERVITLSGIEPQYVSRGETYIDPGATSDSGSTVTIDTSALDMNTLGTYTVTYNTIDSNHITGTRTRTVIVDDGPNITLNGSNPYYISTGSSVYVDPGSTYNRGDSVTVDSSAVNLNVAGSYSVTYNVTNASETRSVVVRSGPTITLVGSDPYTVSTGSTYTDPGATSSGGETVTIDTNDLNVNSSGTYTIIYSATDSNGTTALYRRVVEVVAPSITLIGDNPYYIYQYTSYSDPGAISSGGETVNIDTSSINTNVAGSYTVTYSISDVSVTRNIVVLRTFSNNESLLRLGDTIYGEKYSDRSGYSVSISNDGTRVAIGAIFNESIGADLDTYGHIRVYEWDYTINNWIQIGGDIDGKNSDSSFGMSVSISGDGTRVLGVAQQNRYAAVYEWNSVSTTWIQMGQDLATGYTNRGSRVSGTISSDGNVVAVGMQDAVNGYLGEVVVYIWDYETSTWIQKGQVLTKTTTHWFGASVSLTSDGNMLVVASAYAGIVEVYGWNSITSMWNMLGTSIPIPPSGSYVSACTTDISMDGNFLVIGSRYHVSVYNLDATTNTWSQIGQTLTGFVAGDTCAVSISNNGKLIAVGDDFGISPINGMRGIVHIYGWSPGDNTWIRLGLPISFVDLDQFGNSVSLSGDGTRVACGSPRASSDAGACLIYSVLRPPSITNVVPRSVELNSTYTDSGFITDSNYDILSSNISNVSISTTGSYIVNDTAYDPYSNLYSYASRYVVVGGEVITIIGDNPYYMKKGEVYTEPGASSNPLGLLITIDSTNVNNSVPGTYKVTYSLESLYGITIYVERTVIVEDTIITLNGPNPYVLYLGDSYTELGATSSGG